jgi:hypothetical protein
MVNVEREKLETVQWRELILRRINLDDRALWGEGERRNWNRLKVRVTAF